MRYVQSGLLKRSGWSITGLTVPDLQVQMDLQSLAGRLTHRAANTESERAAAEFLRDRLREYTPNVEMDEFYSPDRLGTVRLLLREFVVVGVLAFWWRGLPFATGGRIYCYLVEFCGYQVMSRFIPHFETQNVIARLLRPQTTRNARPCAHYDSGKTGRWPGPFSYPYISYIPYVVSGGDAYRTLTCAIQVWVSTKSRRPDARGALGGDGVLIGVRGSHDVERIRGGVARGRMTTPPGCPLLRCSALSQKPVDNMDVHFVATGSNHLG